jgi:hypothetical protein
MKFDLVICFCCLVIFGLGCKNDDQHHDHSSMNHSMKMEAVEIPVRAPDSMTQEMINRYQKVVSELYGDEVNEYIFSRVLQTIDDKIAKATGNEKIELTVQKAIAHLNYGETDKSIELINSILTQISAINNPEIQDFKYGLNKQLAIAYMRKAEQENCILNHNNESCIIPMTEKAQHKLREGSEKTIQILLELLKVKPDDREAQYLLNIAHMTLGSYPDAVPVEHRIPPSYFESEEDFPRFKDVGTSLGVGVNKLSGGTCLDDFNNDGYLDIMASSWGLNHQIQYFENDKKGGFIDKTNGTGLIGVCAGLNLRHADYNNDGHLDFMILRGAWLDTKGNIPNSLIRNNGDGTFTDVTLEAGVYSLHPTQTAVWADFNLDGWVDLFIANESTPNGINECELYINQGDGTFENKISESGLAVAGYFKGVAVGDINNDRYPDIYLSNLFGDNFLMVNYTEGNVVKFGQLTNVTGLEKPQFSFPTWMFDYNNDGKDDIFVSGYSTYLNSPATLMMDYTQRKVNENRPYLYKNLGRGRFAEVSLKVGLDEPVTTMGCSFGDLDNDGFLDFYLASGSPNFYSIVPNKMYLNKEGETFTDITYASGFGHIQKGHAVGFGDLDMDGDQDIYTVMGGAYEGDVYSNLLFENPIGNKNNWINIKVIGTKSNSSAFGAKLILSITENGAQRKIYHNVGYDASFGGNSLLAEIGVGKASKIDKIEVLWPIAEMTSSTFENVDVNQHIIITEGESEIKHSVVKATPFVLNHDHHH